MRPVSLSVSSTSSIAVQGGDVRDAETVFDRLQNKTQHVHGAMMKGEKEGLISWLCSFDLSVGVCAGYVKNGMADRAMKIFAEIKSPDAVNTMLMLNACAQLKTEDALALVRRAAPNVIKSFHSNPRLATALIDALMACGDVKGAELVFEKLTDKSQYAFGVMIKGWTILSHSSIDRVALFAGYLTNEMPSEAMRLFKEIKDPDGVNVLLLFNACAQLRTEEALSLAKAVSSKMSKSCHSNSQLLTSLIDALMQCGDVVAAERAFENLAEKTQFAFGVMIKGWTILHSSVYRVALSAGYLTNEMPSKAMRLFKEIKDPDGVNVLLLFNACAQLRTEEALSLVKTVSSKMSKSCHSNSQLLTSLIDALMQCGDVVAAEQAFEKLPEKTQCTFGVMIKG